MLSIVVPALNEADVIADTLGDLRLAMPAAAELIVADGGSTDGTPDVARGLADRLVTAPAGRAAQQNAGAGVARGEVLWFVHADTRVPAEAFVQLQRALAAGAVWGRFDARLDGRHPGLPMVAWLMNHRSCLTGIATGDQGLFVTREAFRRVGGFPSIPLMEDVEISRRLKRVGRCQCLPGPLLTSARRWDRDGLMRTVMLMWRLRLAFFFGADPAELHRRYSGRRPA